MNDLRKLTRIIFSGLMLYILINAGLSLFLTLPYLLTTDSLDKLALFQPLSVICLAAVLLYVLLHKADWLTERIARPQEPIRADVSWLPTAFRLACVFCGILVLYRVIPAMISTARAYLIVRHEPLAVQSPTVTGNQILAWIILLILALYLLYGAPHFVRWQVRKTQQQCAGTARPENQKSREPDKES